MDRNGDREPDVVAHADDKVAGMIRFVGMAHAHGIKILTGTDTPVSSVVPGVSLHRELELLVAAGMTPEEAIHSSTGRASEALRHAETGTLAPGKLANLVIVDGDLPQDIVRSRSVRRVSSGVIPTMHKRCRKKRRASRSNIKRRQRHHKSLRRNLACRC